MFDFQHEITGKCHNLEMRWSGKVSKWIRTDPFHADIACFPNSSYYADGPLHTAAVLLILDQRPTKLKEGRKGTAWWRKTTMLYTATVLSIQGSNKRGTEIRHSIHIRQNSTFSCAARHWGAQSSGSGQIQGNSSICRENTATCSLLLSFQVEALNVTRRRLRQIANHQGFPPGWQATTCSGLLEHTSLMTEGPDLTIEWDANETMCLLQVAKPPATKVTLCPSSVLSVRWHQWHTVETSPTICAEDYYNEAKGHSPCFLHVSNARRRLMIWVVKLLSTHNPTES